MATQSDATDVGDSQVLHTEAKLEVLDMDVQSFLVVCLIFFTIALHYIPSSCTIQEGTSGELLVDTSADSTVIQALNEKIEDVEAQIAQACEAENFELAGIL